MIIDGSVVRDLEYQREDAVTATGGVIQIMGGDDFVFNSLIEVLDGVLGIVALEDEQIFD